MPTRGSIGDQKITIAGAGLAGLCTALELARRGVDVTVFDPSKGPGIDSVARYAGGMLAPYCERESAEEQVITLGVQAAEWWAKITPVQQRGTLVLAPARDGSELDRFARRTRSYEWQSKQEIWALEPDLGARFSKGLFFANEAHLNPRKALPDLAKAAERAGVTLRFGQGAPNGVDLDCTGMVAQIPNLRPVRGEIAILHCPEVEITRTIRLLHPRIPLYLVPRGDGVYMIGATMVESSSDRPPTVRAISELLSAAFTLHPAFAEASVIETGAGLRPTFADNLPKIVAHNGRLHLNGLYRHGFLLAPAMARKAADILTTEASDEHLG